MKKLCTLLCIAVAFAACTPNGNGNNNNGNNNGNNNNNPGPGVTYSSRCHWIPNWYDNDTLYATVYDSLNNVAGLDMVYTKTIGDTSCLVYHGTKLYIWKACLVTQDTFRQNQPTYVTCCVNTVPFDSTQSWSNSAITSASPHLYINAQGTWQHQEQSIIVYPKHFANVSGGVYYSIKVH